MSFAAPQPIDQTTPHLCTALSGELGALERTLIDAAPQIERWFRLQWQQHTPPFYSSVDVRNGGYKIAPVDTNLYPGGFNNLSAEMLPLAVMAAQTAVEKYCADAKNLLLIPERHTRNTFYLQNVAQLVQILRQTGLNVRLGTLSDEIAEPTTLYAADGAPLLLEPLLRVNDASGETGRLMLAAQPHLGLPVFDPCMILLNNDLTAGIPHVLRGLDSQVLLPPLHAGWAVRKKSQHFSAYNTVVNDFAASLNIDPWLMNPYFEAQTGVDFTDGTGTAELADKIDAVLAKTQVKFTQYGILDAPFVIVKADAGTYGMGIMKVTHGDDVRALNRKQRNKMAVIKEGMAVHDVIIQEGVPTIERVNEGSAEPVVYMIDRFVVGGFYRSNPQRGIDENLNAPGMSFQPLPFAKPCILPDCSDNPCAQTNRFYTYGVIARLAALAAAVELEQTAQ